MKISLQKANELGLTIQQLIGYREFLLEKSYCPGGGYTPKHLKSELIKKIEKEDDSLILVNFNYRLFNRTNSGGYYGILGFGDVYKL